MVDYVVVLRRTIDSLPKNTPEIRERVYAKARQTVQSKLEMVNPQPSAGLVQRQLAALEDAIHAVETDYAPAVEDVPPVAVEPPVAPRMPVAPPPVSEAPPAPPPVFEAPSTPPIEPEPEPEPDPEPLPPPVAEPVRMPEFGDVLPQSVPAEARVEAIVAPLPPLREQPTLPPLAKGTPPKQPYEDEFADVFGPDDEPGQGTAVSLDTPLMPELPKRAVSVRRKSSPLVWPAVGLAVIALAGVGAWTQRDALTALFAGPPPATEPAAPTPAPTPEPAPEAADGDAPRKFTQRLNEDGTEQDAGVGAAEGEASFAPFQPGDALPAPQPDAPSAPAETAAAPAEPAPAAEAPAPVETPAAPAAEQGIAIGQKAIFYEERTSGSEGSALPGAVVWSVVRESPGGDRAPEPAVRGEISVPENGLRVRMTLRRNADPTLPASHILELVVTVPEGFAGGAIDEVQRVNLKPTEENAGASLVAVPVRIADGFFLVALDQAEAAQARNLALIAEQNWLDIPVVYRTGRRALFTMEKGLTGQRVFKEVLDAWAAAPLQ